MEEIEIEDLETLEAAEEMFNQLKDGTFYKNQEESGFSIKYLE